MTPRRAGTCAAAALLAALALLAGACGGADDAPTAQVPQPPQATEPATAEPGSAPEPPPGEPPPPEPAAPAPAASEPEEPGTEPEQADPEEPGIEPEEPGTEPEQPEPEVEPERTEPEVEPENSGSGEPEPEEPEEPAEPPYAADLPWGRFELAEHITTKLDDFGTLNFVLSAAGTALPVVGEATEAGWNVGTARVADAAGREIAGRLVGPFRPDVEAQIAEIESLLEAGGIDCLAVEASDPEAFAAVIDRAVETGVPTFTVGADSPASKRFALYAFDERAAGRLAGTATGRWVTDYGLLVRRAALMSTDPEDPAHQDRMKGFVEGVLDELPKLEFVNTPAAGVAAMSADADAAYADAERWLVENPDVDLIFHTDAGLEALSIAIANLSLYGDFYVIGFGINETIGNLIRDGVVAVAAVEGYAGRAARAAEACGDFLLGGTYETGHVMLEPTIVTEVTVDEADWRLAANR